MTKDLAKIQGQVCPKGLFDPNIGFVRGLTVYHEVLQDYLIVFFLFCLLDTLLGIGWIILFWPWAISYKPQYGWMIFFLLAFQSTGYAYPWMEMFRLMGFSIVKYAHYDNQHLSTLDSQVDFLNSDLNFFLGLVSIPWLINWIFPWASNASVFLFTLISHHRFSIKEE